MSARDAWPGVWREPERAGRSAPRCGYPSAAGTVEVAIFAPYFSSIWAAL